jgi:hypothetical protein
MKYVYRVIVLAFLLLGIPRCTLGMIDDYRHPELWSADINHCFPLEVGMLVVALLMCVWLGREIFLALREQRKGVRRARQ